MDIYIGTGERCDETRGMVTWQRTRVDGGQANKSRPSDLRRRLMVENISEDDGWRSRGIDTLG